MIDLVRTLPAVAVTVIVPVVFDAGFGAVATLVGLAGVVGFAVTWNAAGKAWPAIVVGALALTGRA